MYLWICKVHSAGFFFLSFVASVCIFVFMAPVQRWISACAWLFLLLSFISRWQIPGPSASLSSRRSLQVDPLTVISRYIYVLGAERRLAVTCVREVVALMEFYTWQPSRQQWYVFKILSRNKTGFCYLLGQVGLFLSPVAPGGPGDSTGSRWRSKRKVYPITRALLHLKKTTLMNADKGVFIPTMCGMYICMHAHNPQRTPKGKQNACTDSLHVKHVHTCNSTQTHWLLRHSCSSGGFLFSVCVH